MSWKCNEEPYSGKNCTVGNAMKNHTSGTDVADRPNKRKAEIRTLDLVICRLLVTFMISFGGVGSREN